MLSDLSYQLYSFSHEHKRAKIHNKITGTQCTFLMMIWKQRKGNSVYLAPYCTIVRVPVFLINSIFSYVDLVVLMSRWWRGTLCAAQHKHIKER